MLGKHICLLSFHCRNHHFIWVSDILYLFNAWWCSHVIFILYMYLCCFIIVTLIVSPNEVADIWVSLRSLLLYFFGFNSCLGILKLLSGHFLEMASWIFSKFQNSDIWLMYLCLLLFIFGLGPLGAQGGGRAQYLDGVLEPQGIDNPQCTMFVLHVLEVVGIITNMTNGEPHLSRLAGCCISIFCNHGNSSLH